ncbi:unnamed protein product [Ixodes persulcatus]
MPLVKPWSPLTGVKGLSPSRVRTSTPPCVPCPVTVRMETPPTLLALPAEPCRTPGVLQWRSNPGDCTAPKTLQISSFKVVSVTKPVL